MTHLGKENPGSWNLFPTTNVVGNVQAAASCFTFTIVFYYIGYGTMGLMMRLKRVSVCSPSCAGSGASTYTLDSGIGTFPLPDCSSGAAGRGLSRMRGEHHPSGSPGRTGRRARTLDRELTSQDECYTPHKQLIPTIQYSANLEGRSSAGVLREGADTHHSHLDIRGLVEVK